MRRMIQAYKHSGYSPCHGSLRLPQSMPRVGYPALGQGTHANGWIISRHPHDHRTPHTHTVSCSHSVCGCHSNCSSAALCTAPWHNIVAERQRTATQVYDVYMRGCSHEHGQYQREQDSNRWDSSRWDTINSVAEKQCAIFYFYLLSGPEGPESALGLSK